MYGGDADYLPYFWIYPTGILVSVGVLVGTIVAAVVCGSTPLLASLVREVLLAQPAISTKLAPPPSSLLKNLGNRDRPKETCVSSRRSEETSNIYSRTLLN